MPELGILADSCHCGAAALHCQGCKFFRRAGGPGKWALSDYLRSVAQETVEFDLLTAATIILPLASEEFAKSTGVAKRTWQRDAPPITATATTSSRARHEERQGRCV